MPTTRLTKTYVDKLLPAPKDAMHWDTEVKGFGVKVTPAGRKVYLVQYRPANSAVNPRKFTIGSHGEWTTENARRKAQQITAAKGEGKDPQAEKRHSKQRFASDKFTDVLTRFEEQHLSGRRSGAETKRILHKEFASAWGNRSIHEVKKRDVVAVLDAISARGAPIQANRALAAIRKLFNWCKGKDIVDKSPCDGVDAPAQERSRNRVLTPSELQAICLAAREIGYPYGAMIEVLALTGQRRDEVALMEWSDLNLKERTWTIPAAKAKNNRAHTVHLSDRVLEIVRAAPKLSDLVFCANATNHFQGWSKAKSRLDRVALQKLCEITGDQEVALADWRQHDLRRTMVTHMASIGVPIHVSDRILNHVNGAISGVAAIYQHNEFLEERTRALTAWAAYVTSLTDTEPRVSAH